MYDLISKGKLEAIIERQGIHVTNETTPEELFAIFNDLLVEAINSIDTRALYEAVSQQIMREMHRQGVRF